MYGCYGDVIVAVHAVSVADKRDRLHKVGYSRIFVVLRKLLHRAHKLFYVFKAVGVFGISALGKRAFKTAAANCKLNKLHRAHLLLHLDKLGCNLRERRKFLCGRARQKTWIDKHLKQR